jgi:hypothetical protein
MRDRLDIFGTLPDVIDDDWIDDGERLEAELKNYTNRRARANAFDLRYAGDVVPKGERWELCEKVLARNDVKKRLSPGGASGNVSMPRLLIRGQVFLMKRS